MTDWDDFWDNVLTAVVGLVFIGAIIGFCVLYAWVTES